MRFELGENESGFNYKCTVNYDSIANLVLMNWFDGNLKEYVVPNK